VITYLSNIHLFILKEEGFLISPKLSITMNWRNCATQKLLFGPFLDYNTQNYLNVFSLSLSLSQEQTIFLQLQQIYHIQYHFIIIYQCYEIMEKVINYCIIAGKSFLLENDENSKFKTKNEQFWKKSDLRHLDDCCSILLRTKQTIIHFSKVYNILFCQCSFESIEPERCRNTVYSNVNEIFFLDFIVFVLVPKKKKQEKRKKKKEITIEMNLP